MQLVIVLTVLAVLQLGSAQDGAQDTENHSYRGSHQPAVLNVDHYLLQLNSKLDRLNSRLNNLSHQLETIQISVNRLSGYTCGGTGGWRRVVYLDMADPTTTCPSGWQETGYSKRTCGKVTNSGSLTCDSVTFSVTGGEYNRVCGRIKAYQYGPTDAFQAYHNGDVTTIDGAYVTGISLTHGSPRRHIWTFAAGISEAEPDGRGQEDACPCDASINIRVPSFVSGSYFCESGVNVGRALFNRLYPNDPLWDGQNCGTSSTCCNLNSPPYFVKQLPTSTTDDIEARLCILDTGDDDVAVELVELYVK